MKPIAPATVVVAIVVAIVAIGTASAVSSTRAAMTVNPPPTDESAAAERGATGDVATDAATDAGAEHAAAERGAVERAVADYAEALYDVRPDLIERGVHRELTKRGFFRDEAGEWREDVMTYDDLHALAGEWNVDGRVTVEQSPWRVRVVDVFDQTATALLTAHWGIDHMQLAKYDGRWQIVQVLWQIPPQ